MSRNAPKAAEPKDAAPKAQKPASALDRAVDTLIAEHGGSPLTKAIGRIALSTLIESIASELKAGNTVRLNHFGTFAIKPVKARSLFNPFTKVTEDHEETVRLSFKPTPTLRSDIREAHKARAASAAKASHKKETKAKPKKAK